MTPWKLTLESSPELDPDIVFLTIPISRARKVILPAIGSLNDLLRVFLGGFVSVFIGMVKKIEKPMSGDMIVKVSIKAGDKVLPDFHIRITGDEK